MIVIDSFKAVHDLAPSLAERRRMVYEMTALQHAEVAFIPITQAAARQFHDAIRDRKFRVAQSDCDQTRHLATLEPYYRSEATALAPGVGLGLAISRALLKQMDGELELKSDLGVGSSFTIRLPLVHETRALK